MTPIRDAGYNSGQTLSVATDKMYDNVMNKFRWGGLDSGDDIYLDETVRRMVTTHRSTLIDLANALYNEGIYAMYDVTEGEDGSFEETVNEENAGYAKERFRKSAEVLDLIQEKLPARVSPYSVQIGQQIGQLYMLLGEELQDDALTDKGLDMLLGEIRHFAPHVPYLYSLVMDREKNSKRRNPVTVYDIAVSSVDSYVPYHLLQIITMYRNGGGDEERLNAVLGETAGKGFEEKLERLLEGIM